MWGNSLAGTVLDRRLGSVSSPSGTSGAVHSYGVVRYITTALREGALHSTYSPNSTHHYTRLESKENYPQTPRLYQTHVGSSIIQPLALGLPLRPHGVAARLHAAARRHAPRSRARGRLHHPVQRVLRPRSVRDTLRASRRPRGLEDRTVSLTETMEPRGGQGRERPAAERHTPGTQHCEQWYHSPMACILTEWAWEQLATEVEWTPEGSAVPEVVLAEASCVPCHRLLVFDQGSD